MVEFLINKGETQVSAFEWRGIRLPEIENYLLARGLSYKITSGYRVNESLDFPISIEFVTKGKKGAEISLGAHYKMQHLGHLELSGYVLLGQKLAGGVKAYKPLGERFFVEGVVESIHFKSFYGERNIPSLKNSLRNTAFLLRVGLTY